MNFFKLVEILIAGLIKKLQDSKLRTTKGDSLVIGTGNRPIPSSSLLLKKYSSDLHKIAAKHSNEASTIYPKILDSQKRKKILGDKLFDALLEESKRRIAENLLTKATRNGVDLDRISIVTHPYQFTYGKPAEFAVCNRTGRKLKISPEGLKHVIGAELYNDRYSDRHWGYHEYNPFQPWVKEIIDSELFSTPCTIAVYNTWVGPKYSLTEGEVYCPPLIKKFLEYFFGGEQGQLEVIYWFIGRLLRGCKVSNIIYLLGLQGTGKSIFLERLMSTLLGERNVFPVNFRQQSRSGFTAEMNNRQLVYNDEKRLDKDSANDLKSLTNKNFLSVAKFQTPEMVEGKFSIIIAANPDEAVISLTPNSRRNIALKLPDVKMDVYFEADKRQAIVEALSDVDQVGAFARWLLAYKSKYSERETSIAFKNTHYYKNVLLSYRHIHEGELVEAFIKAGKGGPVNTSRIKIANKKVPAIAVENFISQWKEAGFNIGRQVEDKGIITFISNVDCKEDFYTSSVELVEEDVISDDIFDML